MISTDRLIFKKDNPVALRMIGLANNLEELHIIIFEKSQTRNEKNIKISSNCWVYSTESFSKFLFPSDAIKIGRKIIKERGISEITCQDASLTAMAGVALKKSFGLPLEIQIHGDIGSPYFAKSISNKIRLSLAKKYLPQADKIRVVSNRIKDYVEKVLDQKFSSTDKRRPAIEVRPIFVDKAKIKNAPILVDLKRKYKQFSAIVLMASRLEREKNIELAINAWPLVLQSFPNAGLIIVGEGSEELNLKKLVVSNFLTKSVIFEKWADKETLYSYYKTADLFLNTSLFEGYGMTLVEAQSAGCKIVSTDVGVAREAGSIIVGYNIGDVAKVIISQLSK